MKFQTVRILAVGAALTASVFAQNYQRQATIVGGGGGGPDRGKCTLEVVVDESVQVEIRGATAMLRTTAGQPAQWRRFECTGPLPATPVDFRFAGVDGRGRQALVRDPRNGGVAVIQIDDRDGGSEGYTFDIFWDGGSNSGVNRGASQRDNQSDYRGDDRDRGYSDGSYRPNYRNSDFYKRYGHGFAIEEAVRVCQQAVTNQASRRFRSQDFHFNRTSIDDNPGRNDWVIGTVDIHRGRREERYGFSCSVDFDNGRVRSAQLDARPLQGDPHRR